MKNGETSDKLPEWVNARLRNPEQITEEDWWEITDAVFEHAGRRLP